MVNLIGKPLEDPDDANKDIKPKGYVAPWEQTVTDDKGRRRFHGAFTGGFSAGYFNTVDTVEGWAPKSFKSSRGDRNKVDSLGIEDLIDDQDREDGIAGGTSLKVKDQYTPFSDNALEFTSKQNLNSAIVDYQAKNDFYGIGYDRFENADEFRSHKSTTKDPRKKSNVLRMDGKGYQSGDSFGMGALEGSAAFSVYGGDDMKNYDFELDEENDNNASNYFGKSVNLHTNSINEKKINSQYLNKN